MNSDRDLKDLVERYVNNNNDSVTSQDDGNSRPDTNTGTNFHNNPLKPTPMPEPTHKTTVTAPSLSQRHACMRTVKTPRNPLGRKRHGARRTVVAML